MSLTRRQELIAHLEAGSTTVRDLADLMTLRVRDVVDDLEHIVRSLGPRKLHIDPATCLHCDYAFDGRRRFTKPSRCPNCRSERITWPVLRIG
jgi:transcriptional regulator